MSTYGTPSTVDGKTIYTQPGVAKKNSANPNVCEVFLVHKPTYDGGASGPTEIIDVQLEGTAPEAELCRQATGVAVGSEKDAG